MAHTYLVEVRKAPAEGRPLLGRAFVRTHVQAASPLYAIGGLVSEFKLYEGESLSITIADQGIIEQAARS